MLPSPCTRQLNQINVYFVVCLKMWISETDLITEIVIEFYRIRNYYCNLGRKRR